jgi:type VI secretion system secreted protein VgrG
MSNIAAAQQAAFARTATSAATSATAVADGLIPAGLSLSLSDLQALFGTGLSQGARLIEIESAQSPGPHSSALPDSLVVERFHGSEGINQLFQFEVDCLSVSTNVVLTQFIGEEITLRLLLPDGGKRAWHGYCTSAAWLGADGGLARYRLTLSPFLAFLALRRDAYIFQDKDALGILEELFKDYPQAHVRYEVTQKLPQRAICTQYQESDLQFLTRLLADEGLSYRFEHEQGGPGLDGNSAASPTGNSTSSSQNSSAHASSASSSTSSSTSSSGHAKHCLVVFDAPSSTSQWPQVSPSAIRFHRAAATESADTITRFSAQRQVGANAVALSAWDPAQLSAPSAEAASSLNAGALPQLAVYEGAGQRRYPDAAAASQMAQLRLQALELPSKTFSGSSSARQLAAGARFSLAQHAHYPETGEANQFKLLTIEHAAANNLPAQVAPLLAGLGGLGLGTQQAASPISNSTRSSQKHSAQDRPSSPGTSGTDAGHDPSDASSDELAHLERGTYRNRFTCVRAVVPVVPLQAAAPLRAIALGPQTAIVVGLAREQLTTQRNHCVKVQFAWQRGASPLPGGLTETGSPDPASGDSGNAPGNETSGTWVRVAEALAGPNWGSQFTPRMTRGRHAVDRAWRQGVGAD